MRSLTSQMLAALVEPVVRIVYLVRMDLDSGVEAMNSGFRDIVFDGVTYTASGRLGSVSGITETPGAKSSSVTITLSGVHADAISSLVDVQYLGRKCRIYIALVSEGGEFEADLCTLVFTGSLDSISGSIGNGANVIFAVRSRLADWERERKINYTDADQQKLHPGQGDKGFEFIPQLSQKKLIWPRAAFLPDPRI